MNDASLDPNSAWHEERRKKIVLVGAHVGHGRLGYCLWRDMSGASILLLPTRADPDPIQQYYGNACWQFINT